MKLYVVEVHYPYEGSQVYGVFDNEALAMSHISQLKENDELPTLNTICLNKAITEDEEDLS